LLGQPASATLPTAKAKPSTAAAIARSSPLDTRLRFDSSAKNARPVRRINSRKADFGSQWTSGSTVWNSIGNQRFGVVMKTHRRATRAHSLTNALWLLAEPTCSSTAEECTMSNERSANGSRRPFARTNRMPGYCCSRNPASSMPTAVTRCLWGYHASR
jgi:hypothetical protein